MSFSACVGILLIEADAVWDVGAGAVGKLRHLLSHLQLEMLQLEDPKVTKESKRAYSVEVSEH